MTTDPEPVPEPVPEPLPEQVQAWLAALATALAADEDFAREFQRTPGKSAHAIGIPYDAVPEVLIAFRGLDEARG